MTRAFVTIESFSIDLSSEVFFVQFLFAMGKWKLIIAYFIESLMIYRCDHSSFVLLGSLWRRWLCLWYQNDINVVF